MQTIVQAEINFTNNFKNIEHNEWTLDFTIVCLHSNINIILKTNKKKTK